MINHQCYFYIKALASMLVLIALISTSVFAEDPPEKRVESISPIACIYTTTEKILTVDKYGKRYETGVEIEYYGARFIILDKEKISEACSKGNISCLKPTKQFLYKTNDKDICDKLFKKGVSINIEYKSLCSYEVDNKLCLKGSRNIITKINP